MSTSESRTKRPCPPTRAANVKTWNLNELSISPGLSVQGNRFPSSVAPADSVWLTANTTTRVANDHGLLVNVDPKTNLIRVWDIDTRLGTATGLGANFLDQDGEIVWVSQPQGVVNRLDPVARNLLTWILPVDPNQSVVRGIKAMPDNTLMISLESLNSPASIRQLNPTTDVLTAFFLPEETAPFSGDVAPDGTFFFAEFATNRIARLDTRLPADNMTEWQLPPGGHPIRLFVDRRGMVWFVDQERVGRLDPKHNKLALFAKEDVSPQDLAPISIRARESLLALADGNPFVDILCAERTTEVTVPVTVSTANRQSTTVTPAPSRPTLSFAELEPAVTTVSPVDPTGFSRYAVETPQLAVTTDRGIIYANGAEFISSTFRFYRLEVCGLS